MTLNPKPQNPHRFLNPDEVQREGGNWSSAKPGPEGPPQTVALARNGTCVVGFVGLHTSRVSLVMSSAMGGVEMGAHNTTSTSGWFCKLALPSYVLKIVLHHLKRGPSFRELHINCRGESGV